ncbi:MAG: hypothetical protein P9M15_05615, partial [Candidatus Electryoneaceae bacterium]|nr:hypothetical protein [Candidatus Electryoneaceae bacterium]
TGWLIDYSGSLEDSLKKVWMIASGGNHGIARRMVADGAISIPADASGLPASDNPAVETARRAIMDCIRASCAVPLSQALEIQAKYSAGFMLTKACQKGAIGSEAKKIMDI